MTSPKGPGSQGHSELHVTSLSAIEHVLTHRPETVRALRLAEKSAGRVEAIAALAHEAGVKPFRDKALPPGVSAIATLTPFVFTALKDLISRMSERPRGFVVVLDHIQDPQNLGAICRTAEALGAAAAVFPKLRSAPITAAVYAASAGAVATLPMVQVANINEALRQLKEADFWVVGSTLGQDSTGLDELPDFDRVALVMGAEGEGMSDLTQKLCDWKVQVPLQGQVQSLNVNAAAAILIHTLSARLQQAE